MIPRPIHVNGGQADLTVVDLPSNTIMALDGTWEFYWNQLLEPLDAGAAGAAGIDSATDSTASIHFIRVPGTWTGQNVEANQNVEASQQTDSIEYPNKGYATYRAVIRYPMDIKDPMLKIGHVVNAFTLYINGEKVATLGKVATTEEQYRSDIGHRYAMLPITDQPVEIVIQVANLNYTRGGVRQSILFGSAEAIKQQDNYVLGIQLLVIGGTLIIGLYYLLIFFMNRSNITALWFFLICLNNAMRASVWGEMPLEMFAPNVDQWIGVYINYFTGYNTMLTIMLFLASMYRAEFRKKLVLPILSPLLVFYFLLFTPPNFFSRFNEIFYVLLLFHMLVAMVLLIQCVVRERENAFLMLMAIGVLFLSLFNDMLGYNSMGWLNMNYLSLYGNMATVIAMAFIQVRNDKQARQRLTRYHDSVKERQRLSEKVVETEQAFMQAQIRPHFLYNALDAIANVSEQDGKKGSSLILDLAVYLRNRLEYHSMDRMVSIERELESVQTYFHIEQARFGEKISLEISIQAKLERLIPVLILQPLVENAVRHGISKLTTGGTVRLSIEEVEEKLYVSIEDDGVGMDEETLASVLTGGTSDQKRVGLKNTQQRLIYLYGQGLKIESKPGQGTRISFEIPERKTGND